MEFIKEKYKELGSTNDTAKIKAAHGAPEGTVIIAESQTAGRGRLDHKFYSPSGGLYMSLILRPPFPNFTPITAAAAVAVCRAIASLGFDARIKWVNDIYVAGKKVCGILTEADVTAGWAVLGIGVNTVCPGKDAPPVAGWLFDGGCDNDRIADLILHEFGRLYETIPGKDFIGYYREKSCLIGHRVTADGREYDCVGIADDLSLILSDGGEVKRITCGEVSVKPV